MQLTIFGATGRTGHPLVEQALAAGHEVLCVVRDPHRLAVERRARLHVVTADVMDPIAIAPAVDGADAVLCAIGPTTRGATSVSQDASRSIVRAMDKVGARRLLTLSGSVVAGGTGVMIVAKAFARRTFLRHVSADMRGAEAEVGASDLDWTIVRPPRLTDRPATGRYRVAIERDLPRGVSLPRADLAAFLLGAIDDQATFHQHVFVAT